MGKCWSEIRYRRLQCPFQVGMGAEEDLCSTERIDVRVEFHAGRSGELS